VKKIQEFIRDQRGAELAEYAVGTAILVAIAVIVYQILGDAVNAKMTDVASEIDAPPPSP
jgi:Flp pilus assembly pilin Flp